MASFYRKLVGKLMYLTITKPDLSFVAQHLSQFVSSPRDSHLKALMRIIRYVKFTVGQGLYFLLLVIFLYKVTVMVIGEHVSSQEGLLQDIASCLALL